MDRETLKEKLLFYIAQGNGLSTEVRDLLIEFRNLGGHQADAEGIVKEIKHESAEELQNYADDVLTLLQAGVQPKCVYGMTNNRQQD